MSNQRRILLALLLAIVVGIAIVYVQTISSGDEATLETETACHMENNTQVNSNSQAVEIEEAKPADISLYTVIPATGEECRNEEDGVVPEEETENDKDHDNIPDDREEMLGYDPTMEDTDKDGLPDGYEIYTLYPFLLDSDYPEEGGINPEDDYDKDGLTNLEEYNLGTNPGLADTDGDRLDDYDEVKNYGTDPLDWESR